MENVLQWFWAALIFAARSLDIIESEPLLCSVSRAFKGNSKEALKHPACLGETEAVCNYESGGGGVGGAGWGVGGHRGLVTALTLMDLTSRVFAK